MASRNLTNKLHDANPEDCKINFHGYESLRSHVISAPEVRNH
jgi:hypothetical protein